MDVVDIDEVMWYYSKPFNWDMEAAFNTRMKSYRSLLNSHGRVCTRALKNLRISNVSANGLPLYSMPRINRKLVTAALMKTKLERAEQELLAERQKGVVNLRLQVDDGVRQRYHVRLIAEIRYLLDTPGGICEREGSTTEQQLAVFYRGQKVELSCTVGGCGIHDGGILNIVKMSSDDTERGGV
jgi:hypothetical protein